MIIKSKKTLLKEKGEYVVKEQQAVVVQGNQIIDIGETEAILERYHGHEIIGNGRQFLMPGFIDAHTHGAGLSFTQRGEKYDILENALLNCECALDISPESNSALNALRHIQNGCTTIHHNNWVPPLCEQELEESEKKILTYQHAGIRLAFSCGTRNTNILAYDEEEFLASLPRSIREKASYLVEYDKDAAITQFFEVFDTLYRKYNGSSTRILLGPNWVQGSTDHFLEKLKQKSEEFDAIPIHFHAMQTPVQKAYGLRKYGKSLIGHLDDFGLVNSNLVLGHAVFLNDADMELLGEFHASVTHHPSCNLAMRNGIAPIKEMMSHGINVALGIDEKGINDDEDPIMEMKMMYYLHRANQVCLTANPALTPQEVMKVSIENGARCCGFDQEIGSVEIGKKADLILVDMEEILDNPWASQELDFLYHFIHRAMGRMVNTVVIDGNVVMKNRKVLTIDKEALFKQVVEEASHGKGETQRRYEEVMNLIKPYYQKRYDEWLKLVEWKPYYIVNSSI